LAGAYLLLPLMRRAGLPSVVVGAAAWPAPVAAWLVWRVARGGWADPHKWGGIAFGNIALVLATAAAEALAFMWLNGGFF
jgi:hypothetical protein